MSRSGGDPGSVGARRSFLPGSPGSSGLPALVVALILGAWMALAPPAWGQSVAQETGVELSPAVRLSLQKLQEQWLQWVAAFYRDDREAAAAAEREMSAVASQLGMGKLPDLAVAMTARAVEAAAAGNRERAGWALAAAEALDPGRPEIAFGAARAAWSVGSYLDAVTWCARGAGRLGARGPERAVLARGLLIWMAAALLIVAALFVVVQVGVKGPTLYRDVFALCRRRLPVGASHVATALFLGWPLALPAGPVFFLLWASALVWGHASASERGALVAVWVVAGLAPALAAVQHNDLGLRLSPPLRGIQAYEQQRLTGSIFSDLGVLRGVLPESAAVRQLTADFHRRLGQWEYARAIYRQVLESEPDNVEALLALGSYYHLKGEFASAGQYYQRATATEPPSAAAYYNLSLAHSEAYQFEESRQALAKARQIDDEQVTAWVHSASPDRLVIVDGGLRRQAEIRAELVAAWGGARPAGDLTSGGRRWLSLAAAAFVALLAVAWDAALHRFGGGDPVPLGSSRPAWVEATLAVVLPAWQLTEEGDGWRALLSLAGPVFALFLPLGGAATVLPPTVLAAPRSATWAIALTALAAIVVYRLRRRAATRG